MTRINSGVDPSRLTDEHLLAEHREIKRICSNFYKRQLKNKFDDIPKEFTLGAGHVLFFINKPKFTLSRYQEIRDELGKRGMNVTNYAESWKVYQGFKGVNYVPTKADAKIIIDRITQRITFGQGSYHYYRTKITPSQAIKLLSNEKENC